VSITLEPEQERFIQEQVARGRFKSAHEVLAILRVVSGRQNLETLFDENPEN
jgi:Arc/MetJ-type ribon-helix-helix transcriptional regulator